MKFFFDFQQHIPNHTKNTSKRLFSLTEILCKVKRIGQQSTNNNTAMLNSRNKGGGGSSKSGVTVTVSTIVKDRNNGSLKLFGPYIVLGFLVMVLVSHTRMQNSLVQSSLYSMTNDRRIALVEAGDYEEEEEEEEDHETFDGIDNARRMKEWRQSVRDSCTAATTKDDVLAIDVLNSKGFQFPDNIPLRSHDHSSPSVVKRCQRVVLDFGANIGDTSGHIIDTGMIGCTRNDIDKEATTPITHFDVVDTKRFRYVDGRNKLTKNIVALMDLQNKILNISNPSDQLGPEDYCYYGIEGNPVFTKRLQAIEDTVMAIRPRPIQHMHFFTETVGAGKDGPTKLYLDTVNGDQNYWGSSIFQNHQDVRKSIDAADGKIETIAADVTGITISTLMKRTLAAFDPSVSDPIKDKNHLILKIDIEGGEYPLLWEAVQDGTLCSFVQTMGHTADLYIEFHSQRVTGRHDLASKTKEMKERLTSCGITFRNLQAWWA